MFNAELTGISDNFKGFSTVCIFSQYLIICILDDSSMLEQRYQPTQVCFRLLAGYRSVSYLSTHNLHITLFQEAIKTINDIHSLMQLSKKKPKPQALANYYKKQALVFSKANNRLELVFHLLANFMYASRIICTI